MTVTVTHSTYVRAQGCLVCDFVEVPPLLRMIVGGHRFPVPLREICPECGGELGTVVGRFEITQRTRFFGLVGSVSYRFEPRDPPTEEKRA